MRRKDREIQDQAEIESVIHKARVCTIAMADGGTPYALPVNFGFRDGVFYVHTAMQGRKIEILKKHPAVTISIYVDNEIIPAQNACGWGTKYRSVIAEGKAEFISNPDDKKAALNIIMEHYSEGSPSGGHSYLPEELDKIFIILIKTEIITGKKTG